MKTIEKLLTCKQSELRDIILEASTGLNVIEQRGKYIIVNYCENSVLLCSHLDTVNTDKMPLCNHDFFQDKDGVIRLHPNSKAKCLGADDRAGVYIMLRLIEDLKNDKTQRGKYTFGFFYDEEVGGIGSNEYTKSNHFKDALYKCFVGLDRRNTAMKIPEVATYGYDNIELIDLFLNKGYTESMGSFTDASNLSSVCDISCVNLSVGYRYEHTRNEYLCISDMLHTYYLLRDSNLKFDEDVYTYDSKPYYNNHDWWDDYKYNDDSRVVCDYCDVHDKLYKEYDYDYDCMVNLCKSCRDILQEEYIYRRRTIK